MSSRRYKNSTNHLMYPKSTQDGPKEFTLHKMLICTFTDLIKPKLFSSWKVAGDLNNPSFKASSSSDSRSVIANLKTKIPILQALGFLMDRNDLSTRKRRPGRERKLSSGLPSFVAFFHMGFEFCTNQFV